MKNAKIRLAEIKDAENILHIYSPYIEFTSITFEYEVPSIAEFEKRIADISAQFPYLVCEIDGVIAGYAYASTHMTRTAYQWNAVLSVYIDEKYHRMGIATALYKSLLDLLKLQGYYNAYAGITFPNEKSEHFHETFGFAPLGIYCNTGYKFDKWHDVIWMDKRLHEGEEKPKPIISIKEIKSNVLTEVLNQAKKIINLS